MGSQTVNAFIDRWSKASANERANSQLFLAELCDILEVQRPETSPLGGYSFEYEITEQHADGSTSRGRIDLYKRGCFVLESKQFQAAKAEASQLEITAIEAGILEQKKSSKPTRGTDKWDDAMVKAKGQAERYIRALPASEPNPPFLITIDVGDTFEIFADFTQAGKAYLPFPDPRTFRIRLAQLAEEKIRERLRQIWTEPQSLDPARRSADVTREISGHLAELAKSLEQAGHKPRVVADFLTRCLFCMFAEDVELMPKDSFTDLLKSLPPDGSGFQEVVQQLFRELNTGTGDRISVVLRKKLLQFNGGLFADDTVLPINGLQLGLLKQAASQNWRNVEPAIFGTLLERALNPDERHKLGAHYTPRAYVERLVLPTVVEPLRAEWESVRAAALTHARAGKIKDAADEINRFHDHLCQVKVLDPACGSGNFLYVALEHLKRLEGEVLDFATQFGESFKLDLSTHAVDPHQFLGIEINPRAAAIAELVLWIGYLQWHFRTRGRTVMPEEPVLKSFKNIECRDAVLAYDSKEIAHDEHDKPLSRWDGTTYKKHPATGEDVPDENARAPVYTYTNPHKAEWPEADYVVGNPPFIGKRGMRSELGREYIDALRHAHPSVPESADFVMYWWDRAAELTREGKVRRFGFITTNSITQAFNRRVLEAHMGGKGMLSLKYATPDAPWVDSSDGADVRIAMTVADAKEGEGVLDEIARDAAISNETPPAIERSRRGKIQPDLSIGAKISAAIPLAANIGLCAVGFQLNGQGFVVTKEEAKALGLGRHPELDRVIRPISNGRDLTQRSRDSMVIDLDGYTADQVCRKFPEIYQWILERVKPERDHNPERSRRENWWLFGRRNTDLRNALEGLSRYVAGSVTSKHRILQFLDARQMVDSTSFAIALDDAFYFGVLHSRAHGVWAVRAGSKLGVGNDPRYNKTTCFEPFPFPDCTDGKKQKIRDVAEELDAHRSRQQQKFPDLALTDMYNVLEKLRAGEPLNNKDKQIHDAALVSVLRQLHDDLDAAVFAAYGWPTTLTDAEILERLVALNAERAKEESTGLIRYLRPDYQNPTGTKAQQSEFSSRSSRGNEAQTSKSKFGSSRRKEAQTSSSNRKKLPWPKKMSDRVKAVHTALSGIKDPITSEEMAQKFARADAKDIAEILETLTTMGHARRTKNKNTYLP